MLHHYVPLRLGNIPLIPPRVRLTQPLPVRREKQKRRRHRQADKRRDEERVLQTHVFDPGREAIADGKAHRITYQDYGHDSFVAQGVVCVEAVSESQLQRGERHGSDDAHGDDGADPMDAVGCADAVEDETTGHEEETGQEEPKTELRFEVTAAPTGEPDGETIAERATVEVGDEDADEWGDVGEANQGGTEVVRG